MSQHCLFFKEKWWKSKLEPKANVVCLDYWRMGTQTGKIFRNEKEGS